MFLDVVLVVVTALLTVVLTFAAAWQLYQRYVKTKLTEWIDTEAAKLTEQVKEGVREGVQQGIKDGIADVGDTVVQKTKEGAAKTGFGMVEDGINFWLRAGRGKKSRDDEGES